MNGSGTLVRQMEAAVVRVHEQAQRAFVPKWSWFMMLMSQLSLTIMRLYLYLNARKMPVHI